MGTIFQVLLLGSSIGKSEGKKLSVLMVQPNTKDLLYMTGLYQARKIAPVIDRSFSLGDVPEALRYLGEGRAKGKIVIVVEKNNKT